jgi:hypothetical protein
VQSSVCWLTNVQLPSQCVRLPRCSRRARERWIPGCKNGVRIVRARRFRISNTSSVEWARDNIEAFGGDPENMIIWGQSAGRWLKSCLEPTSNQTIHRSGPGRLIYICQRRRSHRKWRDRNVRSRQQPCTRQLHQLFSTRQSCGLWWP